VTSALPKLSSPVYAVLAARMLAGTTAFRETYSAAIRRGAGDA